MTIAENVDGITSPESWNSGLFVLVKHLRECSDPRVVELRGMVCVCFSL